MDLFNELQTKQSQLNVSIKKLRETGSNYAKAERDYKILLRQEVLKLRDEGQAIGVISLICYGIPSVAKARFERDVAKTIYEANKEAINTLKIEIKLINSQLEKEWSQSGNN
jgi:hypothetical protein